MTEASHDPPTPLPAGLIQVSVIGPHSTDSLLGHLREAATWKPTTKDQWRGQLRMFSPWATSSNEALYRLASNQRNEVRIFSDSDHDRSKVTQLMNHVLQDDHTGEDLFLRTITSDDVVAAAVIDELERRGLQLRNTPLEDISYGSIAFISEYDTSYGRELPITYLKAINPDIDTSHLNTSDARWHWFSYPRGLDGRFASSDAPSSKESSKSGETKSDISLPDEIPAGIEQADSLRRLAAQLEALDDSLTIKGGRGLVAVGILGGDVYDKLWLLRALRPRLPHAQFFTNNADAWYWQASELRTTQNLLVASPYATTLHPDYQFGKLPFRDSYQTSVFAATLAAVGKLKARDFDVLKKPELVRLYEVGRQGAFDISLPAPSAAVLHPPASTNTWWNNDSRTRWTLWIAALLLLSWLAWTVASWLPNLDRVRARIGNKGSLSDICESIRGTKPEVSSISLFDDVMKSAAVPVLVLLFFSWLIYALWRGQSAEGEPLFLFSGISSWPTQALRLAAAGSAIYLVVKAAVLIRNNGKELELNFNLSSPAPPNNHPHPHELPTKDAEPRDSSKTSSPPPGEAQSGGSVGARGAAVIDWLGSVILVWKTEHLYSKGIDAGRINPGRLWEQYQRSNALSARLTRSVIVAIMLFITSILVLRLLGEPPPPVRGSTARLLNDWFDRGSLFAWLWLSAFVIDTLWLNRVFIEWFGRGESDWSATPAGGFGSMETIEKKNRNDYMDLLLVSDWTRDIGRLTSYPFYPLVLLIAARAKIFDRWTWPVGLILIYAIVIFLLIFAAYRVRVAAENLRSSAVRELLATVSVLDDTSPESKLARAMRILRQGAFVPFAEQPVMKGLYWLLGVLGVSSLWQGLTRWL